jgi:hypothetical protein
MNKNEKNKSILEKIRSGQIKKRPQWYFVINKVLNILALIVIGLVAIYLVSFLIYVFRLNGLPVIFGLGFAGVGIFFRSFPWLVFVIIGVLIIGLEYLVAKISFAYKRPLIYSLIVILIISIFSGYLLAGSQLHPKLMRKAINRNLPIGNQFYRGYGLRNLDNIYIGTVEQVRNNGYQVSLRDGEIATVKIGNFTHKPMYLKINIGDQIVIFGEKNDNFIKAEALKPYNNFGSNYGKYVKGKRIMK